MLVSGKEAAAAGESGQVEGQKQTDVRDDRREAFGHDPKVGGQVP